MTCALSALAERILTLVKKLIIKKALYRDKEYFMKIYDQHVHSSLSSDCTEKQENYIELAMQNGIKHFVTTEHLDLSCMSLGFDDVYDIHLQDELIEKFQKKYDIKFLKGVEIGYKFSRINDIENIVNSNNYDVVIMSVHEDEECDSTSRTFQKNLTTAQIYEKYLHIYIDMMENISCFDIVGHIDFLLRYIDRVRIEKHKETLVKLFELIIKNNKSLEFNTRFLYRHNDSSYVEYIFELYYACGGRKVSLGSDAHTSRDYMARFDEAIDILKKIGFSELTFFQKRQEISAKI